MMGHQQLWNALAEKDRILEASEDHFDGERYAELEDLIVSLDGYSFEARAARFSRASGSRTEVHRQPLSTLSGGFKLRVLLAQVLAADPGCLLLDEPTNHLDILSIRWLEKFLGDYRGCAVVISHDHRFLDNVCTHILDIDYETVTLYTGNYTAFTDCQDRGARPERSRDRASGKEDRRAQGVRRPVPRQSHQGAASAEQAQDRWIASSSSTCPGRRAATRCSSSPRFAPAARKRCEIEGLSKAFGDNQVLKNVDLNVRRGDRLAIIGPNGIGKSTLLKIAVGDLQADSGETRWGHEASPGYFAQDHRESFEGRDATVESWLAANLPGRERRLRAQSTRHRCFSRATRSKRSSRACPGGEAARLVFAGLAVDQPNVLVLDEPTNHLDLEAIEALVAASQHSTARSSSCRTTDGSSRGWRPAFSRSPPQESTTIQEPTTSIWRAAGTTTWMPTPRCCGRDARNARGRAVDRKRSHQKRGRR